MAMLDGKTMMITGASRGIGAAAARIFAEAGANVCLLARSRNDIAEIAGQIGPKALAIPCDVSRYWEVEAAVRACVETFGRLDILINNAGVIEPIESLAQATPDAWGHVIDINVKGVFHGMRAALPVMIAEGGGTILTISSGAAHGAMEGWSAYCTSKAGAAMLTKCAHAEGMAQGIRAMGLSPGTVAPQGGAPSRQRLDDAYAALGVSPEASDEEVKRAYRKLMVEHHPDRTAAKGLPEAMRGLAEQRARDINAAYDLIKRARDSN